MSAVWAARCPIRDRSLTDRSKPGWPASAPSRVVASQSPPCSERRWSSSFIPSSGVPTVPAGSTSSFCPASVLGSSSTTSTVPPSARSRADDTAASRVSNSSRRCSSRIGARISLLAALAEAAAVGVPAPLRLGCGELPRAFILLVALTVHLLLSAPLCLGGPPLVRRQTPLAHQGTHASECSRHGHHPLDVGKQPGPPTLRLPTPKGKARENRPLIRGFCALGVPAMALRKPLGPADSRNWHEAAL